MKLSEENQKWLDSRSFHPTELTGYAVSHVYAEEKLLEMQQRIDELERRNGDLQFALDEILYAYRTAVHSFTPSQYQNDTDNLRCVIARHLNKESK